MIQILVLLFLFPVISWAACVGSSPIWTTDGNESADVQECVDGATSGDTINVIAGDGGRTAGQLQGPPKNLNSKAMYLKKRRGSHE